MINSENYSIYESTNYFSDSTSYNIILLKECQGFMFNQDLFASPYQQLKSLANEKRFRALSFSPASLNKATPVNRRHTSHFESRPNFAGSLPENNSCVFSIDTDDDIEIDNEKPAANNDAAIVDEYEEYEPLSDYGSSNRMYKVHVAEIVVNEDDDSIFPS